MFDVSNVDIRKMFQKNDWWPVKSCCEFVNFQRHPHLASPHTKSIRLEKFLRDSLLEKYFHIFHQDLACYQLLNQQEVSVYNEKETDQSQLSIESHE